MTQALIAAMSATLADFSRGGGDGGVHLPKHQPVPGILD